MEPRRGTQRIFVNHASDLLTDHAPHGDGLLAYQTIARLAAAGHRIDVAAADVALERALPAGVTLHRVALTAQSEAHRRLEYGWRSRALFESLGGRRRFDIVHQLNPVCTGLSLAFVGCGVPVVLGNYVPHWSRRRSWQRSLVGALAAVQQHFAAALLISTPAARARVPLARRMSERIVEIPYGVDPERFRPRLRPAGAPPVVVFIGSLTERKGVAVLIDAFAGVVRTLPDATLVVAGTGPDEGSLRAQVGRLGLGARVRFTGSIGRDEVAAQLSDADVCCVPSIGEPFGMVALEAMASGVAIVGTNAGGLSHLITPAGGRAVAPRDRRALEQALIDVLGDRERCVEMGRHNRSLVCERYAWDVVVRELERVYARVRRDALGRDIDDGDGRSDRDRQRAGRRDSGLRDEVAGVVEGRHA